MAYALIQVLRVTGVLDLLGNVFAPVMSIFGLPGTAVMVLAGAWLSMGGGMGVGCEFVRFRGSQSSSPDHFITCYLFDGSTDSVHGEMSGHCWRSVAFLSCAVYH